ncbi:acyl-CoA dehydrogenase family protein [Rhodohalobacter sulfatireducens]|uniref:Acyl-CoA dehydrogenase family protein n=1 Tax=Rhodohalobacter sulfatireducens TaxID=2911366 RepID=A0ABS9KIY5_9BACT|nr:acyl-CoA dehydrogenase family protein [Rhodohalobacter sulfatireducens]MCG2590809.1 acyl-CoA dehydrogenase family protein [Rhodohalobacter sulfatireducens]
MNFDFPPEYTDYQNKVKEFAQNHLNDNVRHRDRESIFADDLWKKCADFGIQGLAAPAKYGGTFEEIDLQRAMLAMIGLGYGCSDNGLGLTLNAHMWSVMMAITDFGTEAQKEKYLPKLSDGSWIGCHGLSEEESGSDVFQMQTTAIREGDVYVLNGKKVWVTLAPNADIAIVFALTKPNLGKWGVSAFIVESTFEGYEASVNQEKMGMRTAPFGSITFTDCKVPVENRLGNEGAGMSISNYSLEYDRCFILSSVFGAMERQIEEAVSYSKEREQFGKPIAEFQAVSHRIADMKLRLETSRYLLYKLVWLKNQGKSAPMDSALLKLQLSESAISNSLDFIRIFGAKGYVSEYGIEKNLRDVVGSVILAGTSDIQKNIIAKMLM